MSFWFICRQKPKKLVNHKSNWVELQSQIKLKALIPNNAVMKNPIIAIHTDTKKKAITYLKTNTKISINGINEVKIFRE